MSDVKCFQCGKEQPVLKRCTRCQSVFYCSRDCQIKNWSAHKEHCNPDGSSKRRSTEATQAQSTSSKEIWGKEASETRKDEASCESDGMGIRKPQTIRVNFQKAADSLRADSKSGADSNRSTPSAKKAQSGKSYVFKNEMQYDLPEIDSNQPVLTIIVKANKEKKHINIQEHWTGSEILKTISHSTEIPLNSLKLIHKGKFATESNVKDFLKNKALFQAIGERAENEEGVYHDDIEVLMQQCSIDRNIAIKALKQTGNLVDAILHVSNK